MRVLITNLQLHARTGTELYVRDLARGLLARGHEPAVYTPRPGAIAEELRAAGVPIFASLRQTSFVPDVIHGHHTHETMTALACFPAAPAIFVLHDWGVWHDTPPRHPRVRRHVAVDHTCYDRLVFEHAVPAERARVILNFVDLARFQQRAPLPQRPGRALLFSNYAEASTHLYPVTQACAARGLPLDVIGSGVGRSVDAPEAILGNYDVVFAKAKSAMEAMAVGAAVILCDRDGLGGLVTPARFDELRRLNFGRRSLARPLVAEAIAAEIDAYDAASAAEVCARVRGECGVDDVIDRLVALYEEVRAEHARDPIAADADAAGIAAYLAYCRPDYGVAGWLRSLAVHSEPA